MRNFIAVLLLLVPWLSAVAAPLLTVQDAIKLLPKDAAKNLVRIEARDGTPAPERWYFQVYDPAAENGLREIVIWQKTLVASRTLSQFLDSAKPEDVVGAKVVRIDSDQLIKIAQQYVEANTLDVAKINYTMFRDADNPSPVWKLSCFDDTGKKLADLVINARNASVISHDGFELVPGQTVKPAIPVVAAATPPPQPMDVKPAIPVSTPVPDSSASPSPAVAPASAASPAPAAKPASPTPKPSSSPTPKRGLFQRMFGGGNKSTPVPTPRIH